MREYHKKDFDELIRLLRKSERTRDSDIYAMALDHSLKMHQAFKCYQGYDLINFVYAQIKMARPTNADIYESLRFVNAKVVE